MTNAHKKAGVSRPACSSWSVFNISPVSDTALSMVNTPMDDHSSPQPYG